MQKKHQNDRTKFQDKTFKSYLPSTGTSTFSVDFAFLSLFSYVRLFEYIVNTTQNSSTCTSSNSLFPDSPPTTTILFPTTAAACCFTKVTSFEL